MVKNSGSSAISITKLPESRNKKVSNKIPVPFSEKVFDVIMVVLTAIVGIIMVYPVLYIFSLSLSSPDTVNIAGLHLIPKEFSLGGYKYVLKSNYIWTGYMNTIIRVIMSTALGLIVSIGFSYALAKKKLPGRKTLTMFLVITMFIDGGLIPHYLLIKNIGLMNSLWALILPTMAKAYNIIIMRNFFMNLPEELEEASDIDGCNAIQTLVLVMLPISMPIVATIGLWTVVDQWNKWFDCMLYIVDPNKFVLQMVLRKIIFDSTAQNMAEKLIRNDEVSQEVVKYATITLATLPVLMVYPFIQKYFVKGIMIGSLKG